MKKYDLFTIIEPNLDNEETEKVVAKIEEIVKSLDGNIANCEKVGRRKLAYEISGYTDGYVVNQVITIPADKIVELRRQLKLNTSIIRVMFTVKEAA